MRLTIITGFGPWKRARAFHGYDTTWREDKTGSIPSRRLTTFLAENYWRLR